MFIAAKFENAVGALAFLKSFGLDATRTNSGRKHGDAGLKLFKAVGVAWSLRGVHVDYFNDLVWTIKMTDAMLACKSPWGRQECG